MSTALRVGFLVIFLPWVATAQVASCPEGQERGGDTAGHCCWPGQAWSGIRQVCVGIPVCPAGTRDEGETCVSACSPGQAISRDTAGHCCWPGQAWSNARKMCVGIPQCPPGTYANRETCAVGCPGGQLIGEDTAGHCCWPGQVWSAARNVCVGIPTCPVGMTANAESCVGTSTTSVRGIAAPKPASPAAPPPPDANPSAAPAPPGTVVVKFEASDTSEHYTVNLTGPEGPQGCQTPCSLNLLPGRLQLRVSGDGEFQKDIDVPTSNAVTRLSYPRNRGSQIAWDSVGIGLGFASLTYGLFFYTPLCSTCANIAVFWDILGIVGIGLGTADLIHQTLRRPEAEVTATPNAAARTRTPIIRNWSVAVAPLPGGFGGSLRFSFL